MYGGLMERLSPAAFTFELWANGSLATFGLETRCDCIERSRIVIRRFAIGYCPGPLLFVRPKPDCVAVMFWTGTTGEFWTHLTVNEFAVCFPEVGEGV